MSNLQNFLGKYFSRIFVIFALVFIPTMILWGTHTDKVRAAERTCGYMDYPGAEVEWSTYDAFCLNTDSTRIAVDEARALRYSEQLLTNLKESLWGLLDQVLVLRVINCVPSRFNQDGTVAEFQCLNSMNHHRFCSEVNAESVDVEMDYSCINYDNAVGYALSAGAKYNASNQKIVNPDPSEFHEECILLELAKNRTPLRRICKMVANEREGSIVSYSFRLEENLRVITAYKASPSDFEEAQKAHSIKPAR